MPAVLRALHSLHGLAGAVRQGLLPELRERAVPQHCRAVRLYTRQRVCTSFRDGWMEPGFQAAPQGSHPAPTGSTAPFVPSLRMLPCEMGREETREVWLNGTAYLPGAEPSLLFRNYFLERHKPAQNCLLLSSICHVGAGCREAMVAHCICQTDMALGGFFTTCSLRKT